ncbi:uncharacterized protein BDZ99DRAFT_527043 [Mytilinidion resinicola]|uniref:Serine/threonine-protein kinase ppk6 n=1 Tax=Mytilinidion resinicola TaxID=574789 RepID=A0A6A6Y2T2_9PEZI|nr:uncharacterized protein BDZ99DRAFT_527043 [Mytilinidion resinicola]KAF2802949.1 hypothetical protein BDZ99DRAFT_527043 [Mytilinidion resinicola]
MSSDLFAAFAPQPASATSPSTSDADRAAASGPHAPPQSSQPFSFFDDLGAPEAGRGNAQSQTAPKASKDGLIWSSFESSRPKDVPAVSEDGDDWGDFEGAPEAQPSPSMAAGSGSQRAYRLTQRPEPLATPVAHNAHIVTARSEQGVGFPVIHGLPSAVTSRPSSQKPTRAEPTQAFTNQDLSGRGLSVLFDATELEAGDDDFGDFETPVVPHSTVSADARINPWSNQANQPISIAVLDTPSASFKSISQPSPTKQETQSWDEFAEWDENSPKAANDTSNTVDTPVLTFPSMMPSSNSASSDNEPPPTNIPPPGVLLSLFPLLFSEAQTQLFKPMAAQTYQMKNRILSDHTTVGFLQGYLAIATVAARVIAGRKLRWKRDAHLAQGMRVGPASSRATSGMKLTGIDKSEMNKEEREVLDVVRAWKDQVGRLRSAVAAANAINPGCLGPVPDIQEAMPVKLLSEADGGVPAPKQCALCGLKREERVAKVDVAVEDSFGEWWVEQTRMHRGCKNFWEKNKDVLRQR